MNEVMLQNCLKVVKADDILVFGGDITMGDLTATNRWLRQIPCRKVNVLGNHDISKSGELLKLAVDEVIACAELTCDGTSVFLTHYPVPEAILAPGQSNLHGHIHADHVSEVLGSGARHRNMSVECTEYAPVSLDWLLAQPR
jgi:calcineurin-like phosphoesterase family protein